MRHGYVPDDYARGLLEMDLSHIMSEFRYTVKEYGSETGLRYDFCIDFTFLKENGDTDWNERLL